MTPKSVFQGTTKRGKSLLRRQEGLDVEFKRTIRAVDPATLIAFANSRRGGTILVGVEEFTTSQGIQQGRPIGCAVTDEARLQILNKAIDCVPSVPVRIVTENVAVTPFFRIEVRSSVLKPHATASGLYKIREDGRTKALLPADLLEILVDREGDRFRDRFYQATYGLLGQLQTMEDDLASSLSSMSSDLGWAESSASDTKSTVDRLYEHMNSLRRDIRENQERMEALLQGLDVEDPVKARMRVELRDSLRSQMVSDPELAEAISAGEGLSHSVKGDAARMFSKDELERVLAEVVQELMDEVSEASEEQD